MSDEREQRNAVFSGASAQPGTPHGVAMADKVKADFGLEIPVASVPLPSSGKVYSSASSLHGRETVDIRAMTAREEDILTSKALLKKGTVITELIKSCLVDKSVNPNDLLGGDRNALMIAIRITGYGNEYDAEIECNECNNKASQQFDLAQLPIKRLEIEPVMPGQNLFEFTLPVSKKVVRFKFLTGTDEQDMMAMQEKQKKLALQTDSIVTTNLVYTIVSVDGIEDRAKISSFIRMMPARDSLSLRSYIRDNEPGVRMKQDVVCPTCAHSEEVSMPIGTNFLWPTS